MREAERDHERKLDETPGVPQPRSRFKEAFEGAVNGLSLSTAWPRPSRLLAGVRSVGSRGVAVRLTGEEPRRTYPKERVASTSRLDGTIRGALFTFRGVGIRRRLRAGNCNLRGE